MMRYELGSAVPTLKGTSVQVNLSNLTDKKYVSTCSSNDTCFYAPGRSATATVSYSW